MPKQRSCSLCCAALAAGRRILVLVPGGGSPGASRARAGTEEACVGQADECWVQDNGPSEQSFENMHFSLSFFTSDWLSIAPLYRSLLVGLHSF